MRTTTRTTTALLLLLACVAGAACKGGAGGGGSPAERMARAIEEAKPMYDTLLAIRQAVSAPGAMQAKSCPIDEMKAAAGARPYLLKLVWGDLVEATGEADLDTHVDAKLGVFSHLTESRFSTVNGPRPELWKYPNPGALRDAYERFQTFKFAVIVHPTVVREPTNIGNSFTPGVAEAWLLIFRLEDAALLCAATVHAENDDSIHYSFQAMKSGSQEGKRTLAIKDNLKKNLDTVITETLQTMTGGMR